MNLARHTGKAWLDNRTWNALQSYPGAKFRFLPIFFQHFLGEKEYVRGKNQQADDWFIWAIAELAEYVKTLKELSPRRRENWYALIKKLN
jgi:hypothetical protein